ncbi:MAG: hypothetical protein F6J87_26420 [Spirulina sp. SIO3F2]|nr:hypothetical protein [Spirulina sp. SIO3F2]
MYFASKKIIFLKYFFAFSLSKNWRLNDMPHLLEEMLQKIQTLSEPEQNRIALDVIHSIDQLTQQVTRESGNSLSQMLLLPILEEEDLTIFERDQDTERRMILL